MHVCLYMQYLGDMALKYFVTWTKKKKGWCPVLLPYIRAAVFVRK